MQFTLIGIKPCKSGYTENPETIGEHIKKARMDRGLLQKEVAKLIKVNVMTITNWEKGNSNPMISHMPKIIEFLGYQPTLQEDPKSWGSILLAYREKRGIRRQKLAREIGIDDRTLEKVEKGKGWFFNKTKKKIQLFLSKIQQ